MKGRDTRSDGPRQCQREMRRGWLMCVSSLLYGLEVTDCTVFSVVNEGKEAAMEGTRQVNDDYSTVQY